MTTEQAVRELTTRSSIYVAYCRYTNLPYVTEGEESANDQAWIFASENQVKAFGQKKLEEKIVLYGMQYDKKNYKRLYDTLYAIDVNAVMYCSGQEEIEIELDKLAQRPDFSNIEEKKRPLYNPGLQLCGIYFIQELRKPLPREEKEGLQPLEEEFLANLQKAEFLVPMEIDPRNPRNIHVPMLKNKNGDVMQPAFTDVMELEKFTRGKPMRAAKVTFDKLPGLMVKQTKFLTINPLGLNLPFDREQLKNIASLPV